MSSAQKIIQAAAGNAAGEGLYVEEVFSTYLWEGNGTTSRDIVNGIDLDGEGGIAWIKCRTVGESHGIYTTDRGANKTLVTNEIDAEDTVGTDVFESFNSDGFTVGTHGRTNTSGRDYVSWTFRKAPKFFDVVTYTGTGSATTISHNLGSVPGCIITKRTDLGEPWRVLHRGLNTTSGETLRLNDTAGIQTSSTYFNSTNPTDTVFSVGNDAGTNGSGASYVAYLFAHNDGDGEFGETGDQDIIKCGSVTMDGSGNASITLGFEPSWVLLKRTDSTGSWSILDTMRGWAYSGTAYLQPNNANVEGNYGSTDVGEPTATGFEMKSWGANASYIYIAIRRGPMKTPESGTDVFDANAITGNGTETVYTTGFTVDAHLSMRRSANYPNLVDRMRGFYSGTTNNTKRLATHVTNAETSLTGSYYLGLDQNNGYKLGPLYENSSSTNYIQYSFRRAPGFFDVVAYEGTGSSGLTINHNLGVVPELIIGKSRDSTGNGNWPVLFDMNASTHKNLYFLTNSEFGPFTYGSGFLSSQPTDTQIVLMSSGHMNYSGDNHIAYLFATLPGVSKVFSVTKSSGSDATVDCGFSAGARFVMLKRTDSTGDWHVFDTERGIVAGNDPRLELNTTDAEDTGSDYIDPNSSGFTIVDNGLDDGDYIGLAIA